MNNYRIKITSPAGWVTVQNLAFKPEAKTVDDAKWRGFAYAALLGYLPAGSGFSFMTHDPTTNVYLYMAGSSSANNWYSTYTTTSYGFL